MSKTSRKELEIVAQKLFSAFPKVPEISTAVPSSSLQNFRCPGANKNDENPLQPLLHPRVQRIHLEELLQKLLAKREHKNLRCNTHKTKVVDMF